MRRSLTGRPIVLPSLALVGALALAGCAADPDPASDSATPAQTPAQTLDEDPDMARVTLELQLPANVGVRGRAILVSGEGEGEDVTVLLEDGDGASADVVLDEVGATATVGTITIELVGRSAAGLPVVTAEQAG